MDVTFSKLRKQGWFDEVAGLLLLLFTAITIGASSPTADGRDLVPVASRVPPAANWTGRVGATIAELLLQLLGTAAFLLPVVLAVTGWNRFRGKSAAASYGRLLGLLALLASLATLLDLLYGSIRYGGEVFPAGGYVGNKLASLLTALMNPLGASLTAATLLAATIVLTTRFSFAARPNASGTDWPGRSPRRARG
jgi:S-DNA-T family DNA segregation ATPase FtsK/SpoIIIE